jgi:hypothetical protein
MANNKKPTQGLTPSFTYTEKRLEEINDAVIRYLEAGNPIPPHWIKEYNRLLEIVELKDEYGKL